MSPTAQELTEIEPISDVKKYAAEAVGTFVLVFSAVGTAVFAGEGTFAGHTVGGHTHGGVAPGGSSTSGPTG